MQRCAWIESWVKDCVRCFFLDGQCSAIRSAGELEEASCYVVYFPSLWSKDVSRLLTIVNQNLPVDGVIVMIDIAEDEMGREMCHKADQYQALMNMRGIVNQMPYCGELEALQGEHIVMYQFWKQSQSVALEGLVRY